MTHCELFNNKLCIYHDHQIGDSSIKNVLKYTGLCLVSARILSYAVVIECMSLIFFNRKFKSLFNQNYKDETFICEGVKLQKKKKIEKKGNL